MSDTDILRRMFSKDQRTEQEKQNKKDNLKISCFVCEGHGSLRDESFIDPVEGYKMAPWVICTICNGKKVLSIGKTKRILHKYSRFIEVQLEILKQEEMNNWFKKQKPMLPDTIND